MRETLSIHVELEIRACSEGDLPKMEWFGMYTPHREIIQQAFERQRLGENLMLVADLNGFPVGQVWIDLARSARERVGLLWALRVFPFLKGMGIGRRLVRAAERALAQRGYRVAEIGAEKGAAAAAVYERLGYRRVGQRYEHYSYTTPDGRFMHVPVDQWIFHKRLKAMKKRGSRKAAVAANASQWLGEKAQGG